LDRAGYHVVGSIDDLLPAALQRAGGRVRSDRVPAGEVLDAAVDALAALVRSDYTPGQRDPALTRATRLKRWARESSFRHAWVRRIRLFAWRRIERSRAKRTTS
jgi:hypothetical protein